MDTPQHTHPHHKQILNNLIGNAAKFTRAGCIRVSARRYDDAGRVAVSVLDTGIGIPKRKLHTIFLPFEQGVWWLSGLHGVTRLEGFEQGVWGLWGEERGRGGMRGRVLGGRRVGRLCRATQCLPKNSNSNV